ncbi:uncharacterized protein LOC128928593 [Callithrix jacchus]|uniref:uncharacterized protein LOC128928593 n=1 Tax=Callithrix jacchus TaxID=9483 RepID=UPI0023DCF512|nr:uncharacterized protein LOC128928593 [Callithrix jacchus]
MLQGKPKTRQPQRRRQDLARVKRRSQELPVRATSQPDAPPSLHASLPSRRSPHAPPGCCGGRFPGTFQESASRDRGPRCLFKEARAQYRGFRKDRLRALWCRVGGVHAGVCGPLAPHPAVLRGKVEKSPATANPVSAAGACPLPGPAESWGSGKYSRPACHGGWASLNSPKAPP